MMMFCHMAPGAAAAGVGGRGYVASLSSSEKCDPRLRRRARISAQVECLCRAQFLFEKDERVKCEQRESSYGIHDAWTNRAFCRQRCSYRRWGPRRYGVFGGAWKKTGSALTALGFAALGYANKNPGVSKVWLVAGVVLIGTGAAHAAPIRGARNTKSHPWIPRNMQQQHDRKELEAPVSVRELRRLMTEFATNVEAGMDRKVEGIAEMSKEQHAQMGEVRKKIIEVHNDTSQKLDENDKRMRELNINATEEIYELKKNDEDHKDAIKKHKTALDETKKRLYDWMLEVGDGQAEAVGNLIGLIFGGIVVLAATALVMLCYRAVSLQARMLSTAYQMLKYVR